MKAAIQHSFISRYFPLAFTPLVFGCQSNTVSTPSHPNVLFILTDDMQATSIHALGNEDVHTPAIDSLIAEGVTFTNTYTNGALCGALSMPSRAMLMTGRGLYDIQADGMKIPEAHTTFPQQFRKHGYHTFATGKWHSDKASFNRSFQEGDNIYFGGMHPYELNGHCSPHLNRYDSTGIYGRRRNLQEKSFLRRCMPMPPSASCSHRKTDNSLSSPTSPLLLRTIRAISSCLWAKVQSGGTHPAG